MQVVTEKMGNEDGAIIEFRTTNGIIEPNLTIGLDTGRSTELQANQGLCCVGYQLTGTGFAVTQEQKQAFSCTEGIPIYPLLSARDITQESRELLSIDVCNFNTSEELRSHWPEIYQWLLTKVKPERDANARIALRNRWWVFGEARNTFRPAIRNINRFIVTPLTAKHRVFVFASTQTIADSTTVLFAFDDAFFLGVLSSRIHVSFSLAAGGHLGVGNDPRYNKSECFDPFPFPDCNESTKAKIRALAEELDAHRKRVQVEHPTLTLTGIYNVLEALREERPLTAKEKLIHDQGLVSVLRQLHDELDAAVAGAYGWSADLSDQEILTRLVARNAERAAEEAQGKIRYLRPEYQNPSGASATQSGLSLSASPRLLARPLLRIRYGRAKTLQPASRAKTPWPKSLAERVRAIEEALKSANAPVTAAALSKTFARASQPDIQEILDTLVSLGRIHQSGVTYSV